MYGRLLLAIMLVSTTLGCSKLLDSLNKDEAASDAGSAAASATAAATETATASAAASAATKAAAPAVKATASSGKHALVASLTADRIPRNRDKDGPCPANFVEQPGVENHSVCARACRTEADCHGHTCEDSDIGNGKVCTDTASKKAATSSCKPGELDVGGQCAKGCAGDDKDCPKGQHCETVKVANPNGGTSTAFACM